MERCPFRAISPMRVLRSAADRRPGLTAGLWQGSADRHAEFARRIDVSTIRNWEQGKRCPTGARPVAGARQGDRASRADVKMATIPNWAKSEGCSLSDRDFDQMSVSVVAGAFPDLGLQEWGFGLREHLHDPLFGGVHRWRVAAGGDGSDPPSSGPRSREDDSITS